MTTRILEISASPRQDESISRRLTKDLLQALEDRYEDTEITRRDVSAGLPFVDAEWVVATNTPAEDRTAAQREDENVIDWVLHLPARGSMFVNMDALPQEGGHRLGEIRDGSREFAPLSGFVSERWVADTSGEEDAPIGRIELTATYVGQLERLDPPESVE